MQKIVIGPWVLSPVVLFPPNPLFLNFLLTKINFFALLMSEALFHIVSSFFFSPIPKKLLKLVFLSLDKEENSIL